MNRNSLHLTKTGSRSAVLIREDSRRMVEILFIDRNPVAAVLRDGHSAIVWHIPPSQLTAADRRIVANWRTGGPPATAILTANNGGELAALLIMADDPEFASSGSADYPEYDPETARGFALADQYHRTADYRRRNRGIVRRYTASIAADYETAGELLAAVRRQFGHRFIEYHSATDSELAELCDQLIAGELGTVAAIDPETVAAATREFYHNEECAIGRIGATR
jgi:hypothetical protein